MDLSKLSKKELLERLQRAEESQAAQTQIAESSSDSYEKELDKIDRLSAVSNPNQIPFREISDHKNIMLYTALNKHVGPLHPDNARRTMVRWRKAGIQLFTRKRTDAEVEAFKETEEYKRYKIKHEALRKQRRAQSSKGKTENMMKEIARVTAEAVAGVKK